MDDLPLRTLAAQKKLQLVAGELKIAIGINGVESPQRIAAEVPAESRARGIARAVKSSHQRRFLMTGSGLHFQLVDRDFRPRECIVELFVGSLDGQVLATQTSCNMFRFPRIAIERMVERCQLVGECAVFASAIVSAVAISRGKSLLAS